MTIPIPHRMAHLERDARGYPIPVGVFRDSEGKPHFAINETTVYVDLVIGQRCPICGGEIVNGDCWFTGGPRSAFAEHGVYIDLPMHHDCMRYAMRVCPYLATHRRSNAGARREDAGDD